MALPARFRRRAPALTGTDAPEPSLFEQAGAALRRGLDRQDVPQEYRYDRAYNELLDALTDLGHKRSEFERWQTPSDRDMARYAHGMIPSRVMRLDPDLVWAAVTAERGKDRRRFAGLPDTREEFEQWVARRKGGSDEDARVVARGSGVGGFAANLAGEAVASFADPINVLTAPIGGGARTVGQAIVRGALANMGATALTLEESARNTERMGETYTVGDAAMEMGGAAVGGAVLEGGAKALGRLLKRGEMTLDEKAAVDVVEREDEIDAASPFVASGAGDTAHRERLGAAMAAALETKLPTPMPPAPRAPTRRGGGGTRLDSGIVSFFRAKGYSEAQARGIAAGIAAESRNAHGIVNPTSGAYGLGQWLGPRKAELFRRYGNAPTREQQLEFLHWELQGGDHGGKAVLRATDEAGVLRSYIGDFMRPAKGAETEGDLSRGMAALGREGEAAAGGDVPTPPRGPVDEGESAAGAPREDMADIIAGGGTREPGEPVLRREAEWAEARRALRDGEVPEVRAALEHSELGPIDVKWGEAGTGRSDGWGLAKIERFHPEVVDRLPEIIERMEVVESSVNRAILSSDDHRAVVRLDWDGAAQTWLLSAYERRKKAPPAADYRRVTENDRDGSPGRGATPDIEPGPSARNTAEEALHQGWADARARGVTPSARWAVRDAATGEMLGWATSARAARKQLSRYAEQAGEGAPRDLRVERVDPPEAAGATRGERVWKRPLAQAEADAEVRRDAATYEEQMKAWDDPNGAAKEALADSGMHDLRARALQAEDNAEAARVYRVDEGEAKTIAEIVADIDEDEAMLAAIKACL